MIERLKQHFLKFDWLIFFSVLLLSLFGLMEIYSIALGQEALNLLNFRKQIISISLGLLLLLFFSFIDYKLIKSLNKYIYAFGVLVLIAVLFFGKNVRGTTGWFHLAGFSLQPVEFIKIILLIFLSNFFSNSVLKSRPLKTLFGSLLGTLGLVLLVLFQPDFGSAMILVALWLAVLVLTGLDKKYLLWIILPILVLFVLSWSFYFDEYQKNRILTLVNPAADSLGSGYNVSQSLIAVGSGSVMGRGVGFGSQSQLKFLPEAQNDFIFSVIAEELGFLGVSLVLVIYFVIFARLLLLLRSIDDDFAIFFILGGLVLIFIQMFINIGMNIGIVPVVGISLPFISYGGSAILANFILIGIIMNIIVKSKL